MKKIISALVVIAVIIFFNFSNHNPQDQADIPSKDTLGKAIANAALQVSEIDATALANISDKLKKSCARNKYGLSENECVNAIDERNEICTQETAQAFPGQLSNTDKMQRVVSHYVDCLFQKQ